MKHLQKVRRYALLQVALPVYFFFYFVCDTLAASPSSRITQSTGVLTFIFTNGIMAIVFLFLGWYLFKRS